MKHYYVKLYQNHKTAYYPTFSILSDSLMFFTAIIAYENKRTPLNPISDIEMHLIPKLTPLT
jgi:hypothetical protein